MSLGNLFRRRRALLALTALLAPGAAAASPAQTRRPAVEALARHLETAVGRVSTSAEVLTGSPDVTRALHVSGVGVVVVLPPRALPQRRRQLNVRSRAQEREPDAPAAPSVPPPAASPSPRPLEQFEREFQREMALHTQLLRAIERAPAGDDAVLRRLLELQMLAMREQAEAFRIESERARLRSEREVRVRLGSRSQAPPAAPAPPASPGAPEPPEMPAPSGPAEPPWRLWLGAPAAVAQVNQAVVDQVRDALTGALEAHGGELRALAPQELVTVAVDFVGAGPFAFRPRVRATLVVRASVADLQARAAGSLGPDEFRQRVQARQY